MGETTYIVIDEDEKIIVPSGHYGSLDAFVASLTTNPTTITEFNINYQKLTGERFFYDGNRPKVPEDISLHTIRIVLGMQGASDKEVLAHWKNSSLYEEPNYHSYNPDEKTDFDIPELSQTIINEWKENDPDAEEFATANDYRRFLCNDGIVIADLRKKEIRYITSAGFNIPRSRPTDDDKILRLNVIEYKLPNEWKIITE
ncbi:MAG: hypothetical protein ACMXYG_00840 [Candidatus Woesearchaeota archaeon]